ncbi:DNA primase [Malaciobacter marinus]|uniref:DNA primase n=1 Tax=Malaciobacter marinus TaxID=505249 RepID=UPI0009A7BB2D|nr:DNA primase [Malaciobacter marinus]SKB63034.1 DNA primase [Malaciobacter marinus]
MITKESIDNLKNHLEIVDVVSQSLELKKSGANFKACCPFHGEDTPSFVVSPAKQIYHCFGCGAGGDSIKFVMEYEKLTYPEALEKLASMYNVTLNYDETNSKPKLDLKVLETINQYYQKLFTNNTIAKDYIKSRGISEFSIEKFEIGYAPKSIDTINYLKSNFLNLADAKDLGVIDSGQNGLYSRFIERITFPIYGLNSKIVGFGGRTITGHNAKYVNSPQTKLFNKSKLLYGYNLAKENIYKKNRIIVTEGYLDVIMLHQAGFNTAVATLGTALTKDHLPILRRGEPKVIVAYDGDNAGLNAAFKASVMLSQSEFEGGVIIFEEGKDPADMVKDGQIQKLNEIFSNPTPFINYAIDYIISKYEINDPMQKQKALHESNEYLKSLSLLYQDEYKRYIAQKLSIRENLVKVTNDKSRVKFDNSSTKIDIAELCIIKAILEKPSRLDLVLDLIDASMFEYHNNEFQMLLDDITNPSLNSIVLNERLEDYDDKRLENELLILLIKFYSKQLNKVLYEKDIDFRKKANLIRKLKDNISQLKKGKLVSFDIDLLK